MLSSKILPNMKVMVVFPVSPYLKVGAVCEVISRDVGGLLFVQDLSEKTLRVR